MDRNHIQPETHGLNDNTYKNRILVVRFSDKKKKTFLKHYSWYALGLLVGLMYIVCCLNQKKIIATFLYKYVLRFMLDLHIEPLFGPTKIQTMSCNNTVGLHMSVHNDVSIFFLIRLYTLKSSMTFQSFAVALQCSRLFCCYYCYQLDFYHAQRFNSNSVFWFSQIP